jgi:hypothetical protein
MHLILQELVVISMKCNFQYTVKSYKIGNAVPIETITSPLRHATLGYGYHNQGSNPRLSIKFRKIINRHNSLLLIAHLQH